MPNAAALSSEYVPQAAPAVRGDADDRVHPARRIARRARRRQILPRLRLARALSRRRHPAARPGGRPGEGAAGISAVSGPAPRALARAARALLRRLGHDVPQTRRSSTARRRPCAAPSVRELFVPEFRRDTLALCASFFFCLLSVYLGTNWVPCAAHRRRLRRRDRQLRPDGVQPRRRRRRDPWRDRDRPARIAAHDADDGGRRRRRARWCWR